MERGSRESGSRWWPEDQEGGAGERGGEEDTLRIGGWGPTKGSECAAPPSATAERGSG